jgi:hypothetical protein
MFTKKERFEDSGSQREARAALGVSLPRGETWACWSCDLTSLKDKQGLPPLANTTALIVGMRALID